LFLFYFAPGVDAALNLAIGLQPVFLVVSRRLTPGLGRIYAEEADLVAAPVTIAGERFMNEVIVHFQTGCLSPFCRHCAGVVASSLCLLTILLTVRSAALQKPLKHSDFRSESEVGIGRLKARFRWKSAIFFGLIKHYTATAQPSTFRTPLLTFLLTAKCIARVYFRNLLNIVIQTQPDVHLSGSGLRRLL
jgi:hypothetical protein